MRSRSRPVRGPGNDTRSPSPPSRSGGAGPPRTPGRGRGCPRTRSARTGRSSSPAHRAARRGPCRTSPPRHTAATRRPRSGWRGRRRRPPARRRAPPSGGNAYISSSRRRVQALVVMTAVAASRTARSRVSAPSDMCRSTTNRNRPACGNEHVGGRRCDQPVEQDHGIVGDPLGHAVEGRKRRRVGSRPSAGHGVLVHRPAERGELVADPTVVVVASARPGRIVDAVGHDDVHRRHSGRS